MDRFTRIITYNINGMRERTKRERVMDWARSQRFDFVMLQETHKVPGDSWERDWEGESLWAHGTNFSRRCALLVKPHSDFKIVEARIDPEGRYIMTNLKADSWLTLVCVYVPDHPGAWPEFLESLKSDIVDFVPRGPLILAGDFNLVLNAQTDRVGEVILPQFLRGGNELEHLLRLFELSDPFRAGSDHYLNFTWSNKSGSTRSRLDRFYVQDGLEAIVTHLPFQNSDHRPALLKVQTPQLERGPGYWKLNTSVLGELGYRVKVEGALALSQFQKDHTQLGEWWDQTKTRLAEVSKTYCKQRARRLRSLKDSLQTEREGLLAKLELTPEETVRLEVVDGELSRMYREKGRGAQVRSGQDLADLLERPNAYFYAAEKQRAKSRQMVELETEEGLITDPQQIYNHVTSFYQNLFSSEPTCEVEAERFLNLIEDRFPKDQEGQLIAQISRDEVSKALRSPKKGKAPGLDSLPYEFYLEFEDLLCECLTEVFNFCLQEEGCLTDSQRKAVITLIPKNDEVRNLDNWRPISLQNCDAKILSIILADRLKPCLLVGPSQVCSVPCRQIQNHTILVREAIAYARHKGAPLYVVSFDQG